MKVQYEYLQCVSGADMVETLNGWAKSGWQLFQALKYGNTVDYFTLIFIKETML